MNFQQDSRFDTHDISGESLYHNYSLTIKNLEVPVNLIVKQITANGILVYYDPLAQMDTIYTTTPLKCLLRDRKNNNWNIDLQFTQKNQRTDTLAVKEYFLSPTNMVAKSVLWDIDYTTSRRVNEELVAEKKTVLRKSDLVPNRGQYTESARLARVKYIEDKVKTKIPGIATTSIGATKLIGNIEAFLGSIEIPIGLAGPLLINGQHAQGTFYAPVATTEGALVDSITRGSMAITKSGGVTARVLGQRMMRVPLFTFENLDGALYFSTWIEEHFTQIKKQTKLYSNYANLIELKPIITGKSVHVTFVYQTGDASGQNMTTTCTWNTCVWILKQWKSFSRYPIVDFFIDGNLSGDKKVTYGSFIQGRGIRVVAEVFIPERVLLSTLRTSSSTLFASYQGVVSGGTHGGMVGMNINIANVIAALFTSLGQDIACVHESSIGHLSMEQTNDGIYASMLLPGLVVGTIGGGTGLAQQREALNMLGCYGPGKAAKLAEIIASFCLALDLSTLAAVSSGRFASAHERLGRNHPVNYFRQTELDSQFFTMLLQKQYADEKIKVLSVADKDYDVEASIITEFTAHKVRKFLGFKPICLTVRGLDKDTVEVPAIVKIKPTDAEVIVMINSVATLCDQSIADIFRNINGATGFRACHKRELALYREKDSRFTSIAPHLYGIYEDDEREAYILVLELLENVELMNSANDTSQWQEKHIKCAIGGISKFHAIWYKQTDELTRKEWIGAYPHQELMTSLKPLWRLILYHARDEFPDWFTQEDVNRLENIITSIPEWWGELDKLPKTLIHGDFNPRNLAFNHHKGDRSLCAYDWELATIHVPQRDIVELLVFVLSPQEVNLSRLQYWADFHRKAFEHEIGQKLDRMAWWQGFCYSFYDFAINRLAHYTLAHQARHYEFMDRVVATTLAVLSVLESSGKHPTRVACAVAQETNQ